MIVVADTSPINYLVQLHREELLHHLYGSVVLPAAVRQELDSNLSPAAVRLWAQNIPSWAVLAKPSRDLPYELTRLGPGEREAILLSEELEADLLLIDEKIGRKIARSRGLQTTGTLGVLRDAHNQRLIDGREVYSELRRTSFRHSDDVELAFLATLL